MDQENIQAIGYEYFVSVKLLFLYFSCHFVSFHLLIPIYEFPFPRYNIGMKKREQYFEYKFHNISAFLTDSVSATDTSGTVQDTDSDTYLSATVSCRLIRSSRRTIAMEITPDAQVIVRAPLPASDRAIRDFMMQHEDWLREHMRLVQRKKAAEADDPYQKPLTQEELFRLGKLAAETIPPRVARYAELIGVSYGRITIRHQKTRWGSCSSKGNLNFNCLLMLTPPEVQDYVIVHELCHRKQMNHSRLFWAEVGKVLPDYRERERWLKQNGNAIIRRMLSADEL